VRAVPEEHLDTVVEASAGLPLHVHLSEQTQENDDCRQATGRTPTRLLHDHGAWGPHATAVHATHLTDADIALLGGAQAHACFCPTTERDLGDGIGPSRRLHEAGARLTLGSDSHAVIDGLEEMRAVELDERLASQQRGHWSAQELLDAGTHVGHASLGFEDVGLIAVGQRADLVTLDTRTVRTAGLEPGAEQVVFAASAADVRRVMVDGVVRYDGDAADVARHLNRSIGTLFP
jgi:formiminoglutamate deiminase